MDETIDTIQAKLSMLQTQMAMVSLTVVSLQSQIKEMEDIISGKRLPIIKTNMDHFSRNAPSLKMEPDEYDSDESVTPTPPHSPIRSKTRIQRNRMISPQPFILVSKTIEENDSDSGYDSY